MGQWRKVSATLFFLPQRRPRVWALFLKVRRGMGPKAIREHERELGQAFDCISKGQTTSHEALKRILDRSPLPYAHRPKVPASRGQAWQTTQGLTSSANMAFQMMYNTANMRSSKPLLTSYCPDNKPQCGWSCVGCARRGRFLIGSRACW